MEEKRPGQAPEADRPAEDPQQNRAARPGGHAAGGLDPTAQDRDLVREADARAARTAQALREGGFGDHKGVEGFPAIDRED
ncbi:hypothetical protein [Sphingomonas profundi]|uniref:hypothetical protein n=1 Tax=Alterirhizorhabdus profundi TaxID=2681549 RepID=UPI0012E8549E|nr:hypothetical protein [Sphingomonas profundi]